MIVLCSESNRTDPISQRLDYQCIQVQPDAILGALSSDRIQAVILHLSGLADTVVEALESCRLLQIPVIAYLDSHEISIHQVARLAALGVTNFRFKEDSTDWNSYIFQILDKQRRLGILESTHQFLETLHLREIERTREILDQLQMGLMVLEGEEDGQLTHFNHRLEILLNRDLSPWQGWTLSQIQKALEGKEERAVWNLTDPWERPSGTELLPLGASWIMRSIFALSSHGMVAVFRDVSFEVESGRLDPSGLPSLDEAIRMLSRQIGWTIRHTGIPFRHFAVAHLRVAHSQFRSEAVDFADPVNRIRTLAGILFSERGDAIIPIRAGQDDFLLMGAQSPDRCKRRSRLYAASLAEAKVGTLQIGWSVRSLDQRPLRNGFQLEAELKRILEEQARVAEEALQRSAKQSGGFLYTDDGGYEQFALS